MGAVFDCMGNVTACSSAIVGAISAALDAARCWRAAGDFVRIFRIGLTPRGYRSALYRAPWWRWSPPSHARRTRALLRRAVEPSRFRWSPLAPIAGYRFIFNAPSSVGASVTFAALQAGVG